VTIQGVPADCVTRASALETVEHMLRGTAAQSIFAVNPEKVMAARTNPRLLDILGRGGLLLPDGIGVVAATRLLRLGRMERVPGCEFMLALCELAARRGHGIFLFGGSPETNALAEHVLRRRYPGLRVVGRQHGYLSDIEMPALIERINASGADLLFVALGSPKQEVWIDAHRPQLRVKVCQGVGGTFDVISGRVRRAPRLFRAAYLEWFYRLATQPKRLFRQTALPRFAVGVFRDLVVGLTARDSIANRRRKPASTAR
jgi:N-acetylglucosaminyldiphosphoundecaprenol N-acetyl-beta-D-mannosaminyltransferase